MGQTVMRILIYLYFLLCLNPAMAGIEGEKSKVLHCKKKYILGLKCFKSDEYPEIIDENSSIDSPIYACKFGESSNTKSLLCLAYEDGKIALQETNAGKNKGQFLFDKNIHGNAVFDLSWIPGQSNFISAAADLSLYLWSVGNDLTPLQQFKGHSKAVKCVDVNKWDTNVFSSGGRDCNIIVWDTRCQPSNKANEIFGAHSSQKSINSPNLNRPNLTQMQNSIVSVLFSQQHNLISAGASDGLLKVWDLRKTYCRLKREPLSLYTLHYSGNSSFKGYTSMCISPYRDRIYASCLDGKIYAYHLIKNSPTPVAEYYGHKPNTYYSKACLSPCGSYLFNGSGDDKAYVWLTDSPGYPVASLSGHCDEVTSLACSSDAEKVVTCCDDMKHRIFRLNLCHLDDPEIRQDLRGRAEPFHIKPQLCLSVVKCTSSSISDSGINGNVSSCVESSNAVKSSTEVQKEESNSRLLMTPTQFKEKAKEQQTTPKTSGKKTLLSWLSSSKTPTRSHVFHTPSTRHSSIGKGTSKRKLTDIMESDQENLDEEKNNTTTVSPSKSAVLTERNGLQPSNNVAKMLKYEDIRTEKTNVATEDGESFKLIEDIDKEKVSKFFSLFSNKDDSMTKDEKNLLTRGNETPAKGCQSPTEERRVGNLSASKLASPTANLPNFVIDGRSPHSRRESPIARKRETDWLTSLAQNKSSECGREKRKASKSSSTQKKKGKTLNFSRIAKN